MYSLLILLLLDAEQLSDGVAGDLAALPPAPPPQPGRQGSNIKNIKFRDNQDFI